MIASPIRPVPFPNFNQANLGSSPSAAAFALSVPALNNEPLADAIFCPTGNPDSAIGLDLDSRGNLWREGLNGKDRVGAVNTYGQYWFINGQQGDIFENRNPAKEGTLEILLDNTEHPFIQTLRNTERQRAQVGSEVPLLRAKFNQMGLTGQGIKVGSMDPYEPIALEGINLKTANGEDGQAFSISEHSQAVSELINNPVRGLAPGVKVIDAGFTPIQDDSLTDEDDISTVRSNVSKSTCNLLNGTTQKLNQIQQKKVPGLRILSVTAGGSLLTMLDSLKEDLNQQNVNGEWRYPKTRQQIYGPALQQGADAQDRVLLNFISTIMQSAAVQQAKQNYVESTRQAALNGYSIVVAAGNEHGQLSPRINPPADAEFDELAKSPHVISVASVDTHQTPTNLADDSISPFSSWGDGKLYNPTIAAPGQEIQLSQKFETLNSNLVEAGTSFAVPFVCSVIALMLQNNPFLTVPQIKTILQQSAINLPGYPVSAQGAGRINAEGAIQMTQASRRNPTAKL